MRLVRTFPIRRFPSPATRFRAASARACATKGLLRKAGLAAALPVTLACAFTARAADVPVYAGAETVVTAARIPQRLANTLQSVTVITAQDIQESGQSTLPAVLQRLGGVEVASNGGAGQTSAVFIRGAGSAQSLVLIDGMRVNSATTGSTAIENIPLGMIERVEVVKGSLSSLYGSDAIGGVIQIFTRSGSGAPGIAVSAGYGTYNTFIASGTLNQRVNDFDIALTAGFENSDQFSATQPTIPFGQFNPDNDGYRNANVSGKLAYHFNADNELGVSAFYSDGKTKFDNGLVTDDSNHQQITTYAAYSRNQITPTWQSLLRLGRSIDDIVTVGQFPGRFRTDQDQATWQNTFKLWGGSLLAGAEYLRQKVDSDVAYTVTSRNVGSGFVGFTGDYASQGIQANVRYDNNSQFGGHTTGSLGYGYRISDEIRLRASGGNAFHAPTFNDLYFPDFGNPNLKAERSRSGEVAVDYRGAKQTFSATYFQNQISDLIVFDLATFLPENLDKARIRGGEFSYQGTLLDVQVRAKLTLQNPVNVANGLQLQRRAKQFGSVDASRTWERWKIGAELVATGVRFDSNDEDPATRMAGYALVNLYASYRFAPGWSAEIRWNNIADTHYELAKYYNTPGSNVFVWIRWTPR